MRHRLSYYVGVNSTAFSIAELAHAAGLTRRAVRFYVQQRLLPPPGGVGRGRHYDQSHLDRLKQIAQMQESGHSLDAIRRILDGDAAPPLAQSKPRPARRTALSAKLWTRLELGEGIELQFDAGRYQPQVEGLLALRELAQQVFDEADETKL
jgi:DNA-binding transcriptional MerR regulator